VRIKLARFEEYIANCRKDWIEKETLRLVSSYQLIGVENLSIQGMMKGSRNAKNYQDISWSTFVSKLEQKSQFRNCQVVKVNRFFASSQICSSCGLKNPDVQKSHLQNWKCPQCGQEHQRDENAALNIRAEAIRVLREPEESEEKSSNCLSKDTHRVLSTNELANLALSLSSGIGNARNNPTHAKVV
jgi:putative transposase